MTKDKHTAVDEKAFRIAVVDLSPAFREMARQAFEKYEAAKQQPTTDTQQAGVPLDVVRVCPDCDIAGCSHMRATPAQPDKAEVVNLYDSAREASIAACREATFAKHLSAHDIEYIARCAINDYRKRIAALPQRDDSLVVKFLKQLIAMVDDDGRWIPNRVMTCKQIKNRAQAALAALPQRDDSLVEVRLGLERGIETGNWRMIREAANKLAKAAQAKGAV